MLDKNKIIKITNRSGGSAGYDVPDLGISRHYENNETKEVSVEEILKLSYSIGGKNLLDSCFIIDDEEVVNAIYGEVEPEYFYNEQDIRELLNTGSLAQLEDCLDFASEGVLNLVKKIAVETELNDVQKRNVIKNKLGYDVTKAIEVNYASKEGDTENSTETRTKRRSVPIKSTKSVAEKYKVVSEK